MKPWSLAPDRELRDLLSRFDAPARPAPAERRALKRNIEMLAAPALAGRAGRAPAWWEFAADWARMLIPLGVVTAIAAAAIMLWASNADRDRALIPPLAGQDSLVGSTAREGTSQRLLDYLTTPAPVSPRNRE